MTEQVQWLAGTTEDAIDRALPICDPHHHLWEYPQSRYLIEELLRDIGDGHHVESTIYVECGQMYRTEGSPALRPVGETEYVEHIATTSERRAGRTRMSQYSAATRAPERRASSTRGNASRPRL